LINIHQHVIRTSGATLSTGGSRRRYKKTVFVRSNKSKEVIDDIPLGP